jgi:hydrogenase/urease accessory protein HupE
VTSTAFRRPAVWLCAAALCVWSTTLGAHPTTTFGVRLHVTARTATVILNADAGPLLATLDALSDTSRAGTDGDGEPEERVTAYAPLIRSLSFLTADGAPLPLLAGKVARSPEGQVTLTLTADVPRHVRDLRWQSRLIYGTYPLSVSHGADPVEAVTWLRGGEVSAPIPMEGSTATSASFLDYTRLGFTHILPKGLDHILFVLGLFLLSPRLRPLLAQVSVFTVAHSISLALGILGVITLPPSIVEPLIALSIVYVGIEKLFRSALNPARLWLIGGFGLLHGLGFAGVLAEIALPPDQWLMALAGFNLGVEFGQLAVIALASGAVLAWTRWITESDRVLRLPASAGIAVMGVIWLVARL